MGIITLWSVRLFEGADASSDLRRELRPIVDAELLLDLRDLIDHLLKAVVAEQLVFLLFKIFA